MIESDLQRGINLLNGQEKNSMEISQLIDIILVNGLRLLLVVMFLEM